MYIVLPCSCVRAAAALLPLHPSKVSRTSPAFSVFWAGFEAAGFAILLLGLLRDLGLVLGWLLLVRVSSALCRLGCVRGRACYSGSFWCGGGARTSSWSYELGDFDISAVLQLPLTG